MGLLAEMLSDAPALLWMLDEAAGASTVQDSTANDRDGTVSGATFEATGLVPGFTCASFDGVDDRIHSATYDPFTAGAALTFVGVAYRDDAAAIHGLFATGTSGSLGALRALTNTDVTWEPVFGLGAVTWTGACPTATPFMWALTHDESADASNLFINGAALGVLTMPVNYPADATAFTLGAGASASAWKGRHAFSAVYESVLSNARLLAYYNAWIAIEQTAIWPYNRQGPF